MNLDPARRARLAAMGITVWRARGLQPEPASTPETAAAPVAAPVAPEPVDSGAVHRSGALAPVPVEDPIPAPGPVQVPGPGPVRDSGPAAVQGLLTALAVEVSECRRCVLHQSRTRTVFGTGDPQARLLVLGEAPGADEDAQGEPFVGRAGQLLNAMLAGIGLERGQVYIANILKCRPPLNRDPLPGEVAACGGYLKQQVERVAPELILALGRVAAQNLLQVTTSIGKLRGGIEHRDPRTGTPVLVTYHPAYLLRSPLEKRKVWEDLKQVAARLGLTP